MIEITVTANPERLGALRDASLMTPLAHVGAYFTREWQTMFDTAGASRESQWPELAPSTLIRKAKTGKSTEILQGRGRLRASGRVLHLGRYDMAFGTTVRYAKYHDSDAARTRLPQRKLLRILPRDVQLIEQEIAAHLQRVANGGSPT